MNTIRKPTAPDLTLIVFTTMIWSLAFLAIKVAVPETGPVWLATFRTIIGFIVLLPWMFFRGLVLPKTMREWTIIIAIALLNVVIPFLLISWAELTVDAGITALLMGTGPILGLIASHFTTTDDRITPLKAVGVILGFTGIILLVGKDAFFGLGNQIIPQLAILAASTCYVIAGSLVRRIQSVPPTRLSILVLGVASFILLGLAASLNSTPNLNLSPTAWGSLLFLGVFPTGIAYILRFHLIRTVGYSFFALSINLIPIFGIILAWLLLGEKITLEIIIALAFIVSGLVIARKGMNKK